MKYLRVLLSLTIVLLVSACGFEPMHQQASSQASGTQLVSLPPIALPQAQSKAEHYLRADLKKYLDTNNPQYNLKWSYKTNLLGSTLDSDSYYTRYDSQYILSWQLLDKSGKTLTRSTSKVNVPISIQKTGHPTLAVREQADRDAAKFLAEDVHIRLVQYFRKQ